jgi:tripartite-type tricarboxylate transporter receptor subunit TctC
MRALRLAAGLAMAVCVVARPVLAQDALEQFYRGKTVTIIIGSNVGGGYDAYGRLVGRYMGKYIPGHPTVIYNNMPGAGGATTVNYLISIAPRDGTVMAATSSGSLLEPLLGERGLVRYDPLRFNYVGSANSEVSTCLMRKDAPVKKFADVFTTEAIIGSSGGTTHDMPSALNATLGAKFKLISGYPGTREVLLAMDKGEVQGICGMGYSSVVSQRPDWSGPNSPVRVLVQETIKTDPALDRAGVPRALDFAKTPEQRQILEVIYGQFAFTRPFVMAPEAPADRVEAMRAAFARTLADPDLLADAVKQGLAPSLMSGPDLAAAIRALYGAPKDVIDKARAAIATP